MYYFFKYSKTFLPKKQHTQQHAVTITAIIIPMMVKSPKPNGGTSLQAISSSSKNVPSGQAHSPRMARVGTPPNHPE